MERVGKSRRESSGHHIPEDVLMEILIRLPVSSLLRFERICKNWYDIIRNPSFARSHLRFQKLRNKARLFLQYFNADTQRDCYALFPDETLADDAYHDLDFLINSTNNRSAVIAGPTNGLFCLFYGEDRFVIWNPAIREFRVLPFPHHPYFTPNLTVEAFSVGFGLDPSTDDYKVVLIRGFRDEIRDMPLCDVCVNVYSLSTDTWRHLDALGCLSSQSLFFVETGAYAGGVYYWSTGDAELRRWSRST